MFEALAVETDQAPCQWQYINVPLGSVVLRKVQPQLAAVFGHPVKIQIADNRELPGRGMLENIQVAFVESSFRVNGKVQFHIPDAHVEVLVEIPGHVVQPVEKRQAGFRRMKRVQPLYVVSANVPVELVVLVLTDSGNIEASFFIGPGRGFQDIFHFRHRQETIGQSIAFGKNTGY